VRRPPSIPAAVLLVGLAAAGCQSNGPPAAIANPAAEVQSGLDAVQIHELVTELSKQLGIELRTASREVESLSQVREHRRRAVSWKILTDGYIEESTFQADPRIALIDLWVLAIQMRDYFGTPEGAEVLGPETPRALHGCENMVEEAETAARKILRPESLSSASQAVADFAKAHPMGANFTRESTRAFAKRKEGGDALSTAFDTAFIPLRAITGMDQTAAAIQHASSVVADAVHIVSLMPERVHWQVQLLLYDLEDLDTVTAAREAVGSLSKSSESFAQTAKELPKSLHEEVVRTLEEIDKRQEGLQKTLAEVRASLETGDKTVVDARATLESMDHAATALAGMLHELRAASGDLGIKPSGEPPSPAPAAPAEPSRPFDINEYTRAAEAAASTAEQLTKALVAARELAAPAAGRPAALEAAGENARSLANHVAWLVAATAAAVLALMLGYRMLAKRVG